MNTPPKEYIVYWTSEHAESKRMGNRAEKFSARMKSFVSEDKALKFQAMLNETKATDGLFQMRKIHHVCSHLS